MLWERFLIEAGKGSKKWPSRSLKGGFSLRRRRIFHFFALAWKRHQKGRQKLSKWVPGLQNSSPRACIKWLLTMPASVSWVSTFFTKNLKKVDLHKTLAGMVQTHHRPIWKILCWLPLNFFWKLGMRSLHAMAPRGAEITKNHKKHILEKDSGPPPPPGDPRLPKGGPGRPTDLKKDAKITKMRPLF